MNQAEQAAFNKSDQVVHLVEKQWHYPILTGAGFVPVTLSAKGFVRTYEYVRGDITVHCTTGSRADYWRSSTGAGGYWASLQPFCNKVAETA